MDKVTTTKIKIRGDNSKIGTLSSVDMRSSYITCDIINSENITQLSTAPYIYKTNYIDNNKSNISYIGDKKTMSLIPSTNELYIIDDPSEPSNRPLPIFPESGRPTLNVGSARTYTTVAAAITAAGNGDLILLDAETFTITSSITITNKRVEIRGTSKLSKISSSSNIFNIDINTTGCLIRNLTIENSNTASTAGCIRNSVNNSYVDNVDLITNKNGFTNNGNFSFQLTNNNFKFIGTPASHEYVTLQGATGICILDGNTFEAQLSSGDPVTLFLSLKGTAYTNLSDLIIKNNSETTGNQLNQFLSQSTNLGGSTVFLRTKLFIINNNVSKIRRGIIYFYGNNFLNLYNIIVLKNNNLIGDGNEQTGLIKLDAAASGGNPGYCIFLIKNNSTVRINNPTYSNAVYNSINETISYNNTVYNNPQLKVYTDIAPARIGALPYTISQTNTTSGKSQLFFDTTNNIFIL